MTRERWDETRALIEAGWHSGWYPEGMTGSEKRAMNCPVSIKAGRGGCRAADIRRHVYSATGGRLMPGYWNAHSDHEIDDWSALSPDNHIKHMRYLAECADATGFRLTAVYWRERISIAERRLAEEEDEPVAGKFMRGGEPG